MKCIRHEIECVQYMVLFYYKIYFTLLKIAVIARRSVKRLCVGRRSNLLNEWQEIASALLPANPCTRPRNDEASHYFPEHHNAVMAAKTKGIAHSYLYFFLDGLPGNNLYTCRYSRV